MPPQRLLIAVLALYGLAIAATLGIALSTAPTRWAQTDGAGGSAGAAPSRTPLVVTREVTVVVTATGTARPATPTPAPWVAPTSTPGNAFGQIDVGGGR